MTRGGGWSFVKVLSDFNTARVYRFGDTFLQLKQFTHSICMFSSSPHFRDSTCKSSHLVRLNAACNTPLNPGFGYTICSKHICAILQFFFQSTVCRFGYPLFLSLSDDAAALEIPTPIPSVHQPLYRGFVIFWFCAGKKKRNSQLVAYLLRYHCKLKLLETWKYRQQSQTHLWYFKQISKRNEAIFNVLQPEGLCFLDIFDQMTTHPHQKRNFLVRN